ncbi:MAG: hypothetical protein WCV79_04025 [Candidatus Paceibacterota bacterium]|jgi:hypothetical protein
MKKSFFAIVALGFILAPSIFIMFISPISRGSAIPGTVVRGFDAARTR